MPRSGWSRQSSRWTWILTCGDGTEMGMVEGAVGVGDQWHGSYQEAKVQIEHRNIVRNRRKQTAVDNNSYVKQGDPSVSQAIQGSRVAEWANAAQISFRAAASRRKESENHKNKKNT